MIQTAHEYIFAYTATLTNLPKEQRLDCHSSIGLLFYDVVSNYGVDHSGRAV
jgi:hypothetical protein